MLAICEFGKDNMKGNISWTKENRVSFKKKKQKTKNKVLQSIPKKKKKKN